MMDDSDSTGSSTTTDDQSGSTSHKGHTHLSKSLIPVNSPCHTAKITAKFKGENDETTLTYRWSDLDISDNSSVDSAGNSNTRQRQQHGADDKQNAYLRNYEKTLIKGAHLSNEQVRLTSLLKNSSSKKIVGILEEKLKNKDSRTIVALSVLLPRSEFPATSRLHCARCHGDFNPKEASGCVVRHPNSAVTKMGQDPNGTKFHCKACNIIFRLSMMNFYNEHVNSYLAGACFSGVHTENPRHVRYQGAIRTCEENGCVEFYV